MTINYVIFLHVDRHYRLYPTGTPFQNSALYSLRHNPTSVSLVCLYFGGITRIDVYSNIEEYILPINGVEENNKITYTSTRTNQENIDYLLSSGVHGTNFYNFEYKEVCVLLKGESK